MARPSAPRQYLRGFANTAYRRAEGKSAPIANDKISRPAVHTSIPGPRSKEAIQDLASVFDTRSLNMLVDYDKSYGN